MRKLIVRAFNISLDGVSAEYGTEYFEWCMSGIDPRVPEVAGPHQLQADDSLLDPTGELYQRAYALIMGRVSYEAMAAHFAPGGTQTDHLWSGIFNAARKVVFSRTLKTADWANTTIAAGDTAEEIDKLRQGDGGHIVVYGGLSWLRRPSTRISRLTTSGTRFASALAVPCKRVRCVRTKDGIMAESSTGRTSRHTFDKVRVRAQVIRSWAEQTLLWKVWDRMLETEFIDRSIALAGKAFISFFPLIIVIAAFVPAHLRMSILTTVTRRLGITGASLATVKQAFASAQDIRRATGLLGLVLAIFYASSFTTALRRAYLRAWRRPPGGKAVNNYVRGIVWVTAFIVYMGLLGGARNVLGGVGIAVFVVLALALSTAIWWFTAWLMLKGQVRLRVLLPSGLITGIALSAYGLSATLWMPNNVTSNNHQYGIFGVALALVAWFSGAAICIVVGACAGPVLAEDPGPIGRLIRGSVASPLVEGALPPLPPPVRSLRLADAFSPSDDDIPPEPERPAKSSPVQQNTDE